MKRPAPIIRQTPGAATMRRLMSRRTVLWDRMGFPSVRQGWMAALLAAFLALFILVSAVDAAACAPEAGISQAAAGSGQAHAVVSDADHGEGGAADHVACAHGHCHHGGVTVPPAVHDMKSAVFHDAALPPLDQALASRIPAGPKRPPRA
ncbi:MAG: hypothetical protein KL785_01040 [Brevundimonas sp.]|jgi:hypothetical protein|nr:hypothetical protein [Brevundimonas sp.]